MILFCGIPSEPPMAMAIAAAVEMGTKHLVLNQRDVRYFDVMLDSCAGELSGFLSHAGGEWPLEVFSGIYTRLMDHGELPENQPRGRDQPPLERIRHSELFHSAMNEWFEACESLVVNRASDMASNVSKPYQAQRISSAGFSTPETLITTDPEEVEHFTRTHRRVIYKSISSVRSIVRELETRPDGALSARCRQSLQRVRDLPTQFQEFVPGDNIRVHVVGQRVFATEIATDAVDYRYARRDGSDVVMSPVRLPEDTAARCVSLSESLRLPLCGIDLKRTPDGEYFCFEVNPSPAYSYYEESTGQPISRALVELLGAARLAGPRAASTDVLPVAGGSV